MAPMNWVLSHFLHIFHLDGPPQDSSGNSPIETLLQRIGDFIQSFTEHFLHDHPCPPDQPSGGNGDTAHSTSTSAAEDHGNSQSGGSSSSGDDPTDGNRCTSDFHQGTGNSTDGWQGSNIWTDPHCLPLCNPPGFGDTEMSHPEEEEGSPQSEQATTHFDHRVGSNLAQLVQAMAGQLANGSGFDPASSTHIAGDLAPHTALAAAWHQ